MPQAMRVFLSYGHDEHAEVARRLKQDLESQGFEVWFDLDRLRAGDWEAYIEEGLECLAADRPSARFLLLM